MIPALFHWYNESTKTDYYVAPGTDFSNLFEFNITAGKRKINNMAGLNHDDMSSMAEHFPIVDLGLGGAGFGKTSFLQSWHGKLYVKKGNIYVPVLGSLQEQSMEMIKNARKGAIIRAFAHSLGAPVMSMHLLNLSLYGAESTDRSAILWGPFNCFSEYTTELIWRAFGGSIHSVVNSSDFVSLAYTAGSAYNSFFYAASTITKEMAAAHSEYPWAVSFRHLLRM